MNTTDRDIRAVAAMLVLIIDMDDGTAGTLAALALVRLGFTSDDMDGLREEVSGG